MSDTLTFAPLPSRALIAVGGPNWRGFLQNLITQDVETLEPGEARFGALLTPQGRLLHDLFVVGREDGCWLDVLAEHRAALLQRLLVYRLRAKVEVAESDLSVSAIFSSAHPRATGDPNGLSTNSAWVPAVAGMSGVWVTDPRLSALGGRAYGGKAPAAASIGGEAAYDANRLRLGVPGPADWGCDKTYPIEANFDLLNGVDFRKGCFIGQETTSRMKRRGQVKSRMLPIVFEGSAPAAGAELLAGELRAGQVLSVGDGRAIALARLDRIEGAVLTVEGRPAVVERPAWFRAALGAAASA